MSRQPHDQMERDFVALVEEGKRKMFEGVGASIPLNRRLAVLRGITLTHTVTGTVICTLADDDYLERFRAEGVRHARELIGILPDGQHRHQPRHA